MKFLIYILVMCSSAIYNHVTILVRYKITNGHSNACTKAS